MSVLVSGGGSGIGAATVRRFAGSGAKVAYLDKNIPPNAPEGGILCDVTDNSAVNEVIGNLHDLHTLVCCAGISEIKPFACISPADWQTMMDVHVTGAYNCVHAALPHMLQQQRGRIIFVSSMWGRVGASCEVHYSTAKAALHGMTKSLAKELAPSGITVNCVAPGVIDTAMNRELDKATIAELIEEIPLSRLGKSEEVAELIHFL
ncbi:MAG: SDR family oxidoreductase, partial [Oscillospiraceae bacterium]|nr:SDR family oxidoreductase [Oscillospiraceae bacterium]